MPKLLLLCALLYVPAFAYLDPGSGSLLLSSVVAVFASVVFFIKNLFYKLTSPSTLLSGGFSPRGGGGNSALRDHIVFYSESKQYYFTFKPILDALDSLKHPYTYLTSGEDDPALAREGSQSFGTFTYIGEGNKAYIKLNTLKADICVLTTPGLNVLQIKRSRGVRHYCHIVHSLTPMTYRAFGLDYFDSVLVANEIQKDFVREVEAAHDVKRKYIGVVGSTYLDELARLRRHSAFELKSGSLDTSCGHYRQGSSLESALHNPDFSSKILECQQSGGESRVVTESSDLDSVAASKSSDISESKTITESAIALDSETPTQEPHSARKSTISHRKANALPARTILVSPSWGRETLLTKYGLTLLEPLAQAGFSLIIRPHPQSLIGEAESKNIAYLQKSLQQYQNVEWDIGTPNVYAFARADMMISDFSSVIFDFVCLEGKPVLTLDFAFDPAGYDLSDIDMEHFYTFETLKRIGGKLEERDFTNIASVITQILESNKSQEAQKCKKELWQYPHCAGLKAAQEILKIERELLEQSLKAYMPQVRRIREIDSMLAHIKDN